MSYPTQEQPNEGAPQPPYDAPPATAVTADPNQPYAGVPGQPYAAAPYGTAPQPAQTNGLATAGLILGILPTGVIGLIVSILGLNRAGKIGGVGRGRALTGLILSIVWIIVAVLVIVLGSGSSNKVVERLNPGCISAESYSQTFESKITADEANPDAIKADFTSAIAEFNKDAAKSTNAPAATAMRTVAGDLQQLLDDLNSGTAPDAAQQTKLNADAAAIDTACGR